MKVLWQKVRGTLKLTATMCALTFLVTTVLTGIAVVLSPVDALTGRIWSISLAASGLAGIATVAFCSLLGAVSLWVAKRHRLIGTLTGLASGLMSPGILLWTTSGRLGAAGLGPVATILLTLKSFPVVSIGTAFIGGTVGLLVGDYWSKTASLEEAASSAFDQRDDAEKVHGTPTPLMPMFRSSNTTKVV